MRPIATSVGPPPGYLLEAATVAYGSKRSFTVAREAQCDYGPGTPVVLAQKGKLVPAVVQSYIYNGTRMAITVNGDVDTSIIGVYRDASALFVYGCDPNFLGQLYHFETPTLYDSGPKASDQGAAGMTLFGAAPTPITAPAPRFGSKCYSIASGTAFYAGSGGTMNSANRLPISAPSSGVWCWEGWFYGQPNGIITAYRDDYYYNAGLYAYFGFNAGYPRMWAGYGSVYLDMQNASPALVSQWNHCVWCRGADGYLRTAVNGVFGAASTYVPSILGGMTLFGGLTGSSAGGSDHVETVQGSFSGIIDELRITVGFCPYQGGYNFAPPTKPFGPDFR